MSLTYSETISFQVDFQLKDDEGDTGTFIANGEWALLGMVMHKFVT